MFDLLLYVYLEYTHNKVYKNSVGILSSRVFGEKDNFMENNDVLVSVYCLAYNHEKYIRDCLDGFVKQKTNFNFEVIVHDDASTDRTAEIIMEYAKKYPDIIKPICRRKINIQREH